LLVDSLALSAVYLLFFLVDFLEFLLVEELLEFFTFLEIQSFSDGFWCDDLFLLLVDAWDFFLSVISS